MNEPDPTATTPDRPTLLKLTDVTKSFGAVRALRGAALELRPGEVHVLFGENGAGKSTLINVIAGVLPQDSGDMLLNGEPVSFRNVHDARRHGIAAMFQEFSLAPALTVEQNLLLGNEPGRFGVINGRANRRMAAEALKRYGFAIDLDAVTGDLSRAEQQMVEMAKVMLISPRILILDEPTASLSERETDVLLDTVRRLKADGVAIIYITHRMRELDQIADRITIMRDGRFIDCVEASAVTHDRLIELMTGRQIGDLYPKIERRPGKTALKLEGVSTRDGRLHDIDIELAEGEIVGVAGLVGCGKSEIARTIFGLHAISKGEITLNGERVASPSPRSMLKRKLCYITSDRRAEGLMLGRSTRENIALSSLPTPGFSRGGILRLSREKAQAETLGKQLHLRPLNLDAEAHTYSGGNQQKIVVARALARGARILIFDEPTVGVDVGARAEIYRLLQSLVHEGCSVLLVSSDMPEIIHLSHRVYVVSDGRVVDHLQANEASEQRLLQGFFKEPELATAAPTERAS
ncbi:sugar ABC transporter ATP-binding protein [Methylopila sp. M107]|uniref:sugar ABC transporter ATP-binding protein n=1 Tax=Methylopila sp. M107 TaxID=1101190 RepID=UPI00037E65B1|nr:sugar ABC transporter ATP-binding protein [Methylopila sp. M107]